MDADHEPAPAGTTDRNSEADTARIRADGGDEGPGSGPPDPVGDLVATVTGPYAGHDRYGRFDYRYWRCEACGLETTRDISDGCPRCGDGEDDA